MNKEPSVAPGRMASGRAVMIVLILAGTMIVASCGSGDTEGSTSSTTPGELTPVQLQMHFFPEASWGVHLYGIEHGIYASHGIELELIPGQGSNFTMQQLNENQAQFGQANLVTYLAHRAEVQSETTAVFTLIDHPQAGILTTVEADSLDDLVGKTMGVIPFSTSKNILPIVLQENGLEPDAINLEDVQYSLGLLLEGTVDALEGFLGSNVATATKQGEEAGIDIYHLDMHDFGMEGYAQTLVARNEVIADDPDLVRRMVAAVSESLLAAQKADSEEIAELVSAYAAEVAAEDTIVEWNDYRELINEAGVLDAEVVETNLGYVSDGLGIPHDFQPEDVFTNEFVPSD